MAEQRSIEIPDVITDDVLFHYQLGVFHSMWGTVDILMDLAIGKFLGVGHEEAHMVTWGMMFGAKAKLLATLIHKSDHPQKQKLFAALNGLRGDAKRDVVAHGYQVEGSGWVGFLERERGADFKAKLHLFTYASFGEHVEKLIGHGNAFADALGYDGAEIDAFADAVRSKTIKS